MLWSLLWWGIVLGAAFQALRAWGKSPAIASVGLLWLTSVLLPIGGYVLTLAAAVAMGAQAERELQRQRYLFLS